MAPSSYFSHLGASYDALARRWNALRTRRVLGTLLVVAFLGALAVIELNRQGLLPAPLAGPVPTNHFRAIDFAITLLLVLEVMGLVWALVGSVANSVAKQFELLALILLRKAFLQFAAVSEPIAWEGITGSVLPMLADIGGAVVIFVVVGFYYRVQKHYPITEDEAEETSFVVIKKVLALLLLASFAFLGGRYLWAQATGQPTFAFFQAFYTILIFADILIVLVSLRYSSSFRVVFRNSGFAACTVLIRLALTAPDYVNVLLGVSSALLALGLSVAYNVFAPVLEAQSSAPPERDRPPVGVGLGEAIPGRDEDRPGREVE